MQTRLNPYIEFNGTARQAMHFYQSVFGGKLNLSTYKEYQASPDPSFDDHIMHAMLEADNGITFMGADSMNPAELCEESSYSMTLSGDDERELRTYFEKLSQGGTILEPLEKAPWGDTFGMCTDQYGVKWMVNIAGQIA